ncbi:MAG: hypothetical protein ACQETQ_05595 [Spirochaetota bacterium]
MDGRIVAVTVLNAVVAVALAVLLTVLLTLEPGDGNGSAGRDGSPQTVENAAEIRKSLMERPDVIPFEGQLGGTMDFYDPDNIHVLSDRWVYAKFDDGHSQGAMLLEYERTADGGIEWDVFDAWLE